MTTDDLKRVVEKHGLWLAGKGGGKRADLSWANLPGADLSGADLSGADLSGADLSGADGFDPELLCDLLMLLDQPGPIRAYKLVNERGEGPLRGGLVWEVGGQYEVANANTDPNKACGPGLHVATLPWVMREWRDGFKVLIVEFWAADIACIPTATDGKFRLHRCRVVGERDVSRLVKVMRGKAVKP